MVLKFGVAHAVVGPWVVGVAAGGQRRNWYCSWDVGMCARVMIVVAWCASLEFTSVGLPSFGCQGICVLACINAILVKKNFKVVHVLAAAVVLAPP